MNQDKRINTLYCVSDNNASSGAFLAMVELCSTLKEQYNVNPLIILPCIGNGTILLEKNNLKYKIVRSENWVISNDSSFLLKLKKIKKSLKNIFAIFSLINIIKKYKIDVVHLNTVFTYVGAIAGLSTRKKVIWHIREAIKYGIDSKILFEKIGFNLINKSNTIVAISNTVKEAYPLFDQTKVQVVYDGIDIQKFYNPKKEIFKYDIVKIICNGAIYRQKGQLDLVEACNILVNEGYKNWRLEFNGIGDIQNLENSIRNYNLNDYIKLNGYTNNIEDRLLESDIVIVPSYYEGFGRVTAEGMASGCLTIGANSAGTKEIIDHMQTGILFEVKNPIDLANKISWVLNHKNDSKKIAQAGQQKIFNNISSIKNAEQIHKIYKSLLYIN